MKVLSFARIPFPKDTLFLFSEVEKKKPDGFAEIEKEYDAYMELEEGKHGQMIVRNIVQGHF